MPRMGTVDLMESLQVGRQSTNTNPLADYYREEQMEQMERARAQRVEEENARREAAKAEQEARKEEAEARKMEAQAKAVTAQVSTQNVQAQAQQAQQNALYQTTKDSLMQQGYDEDEADQAARRAARMGPNPAPSTPFIDPFKALAASMVEDMISEVREYRKSRNQAALAPAPAVGPASGDPFYDMYKQWMAMQMQLLMTQTQSQLAKISNGAVQTGVQEDNPWRAMYQKFQDRMAEKAVAQMDQALNPAQPQETFTVDLPGVKGLPPDLAREIYKAQLDFKSRIFEAKTRQQAELEKAKAITSISNLVAKAPQMIGEALAASYAGGNAPKAQSGDGEGKANAVVLACATCGKQGVFANPTAKEQVVACTFCGKPNLVKDA